MKTSTDMTPPDAEGQSRSDARRNAERWVAAVTADGAMSGPAALAVDTIISRLEQKLAEATAERDAMKRRAEAAEVDMKAAENRDTDMKSALLNLCNALGAKNGDDMLEMVYKHALDLEAWADSYREEIGVAKDSETCLLRSLRLILPMAKAYAAEHPVRSNQDYVDNTVAVAESYPEIEEADECPLCGNPTPHSHGAP